MRILIVGVDASGYGSANSMAVLAKELTEMGNYVLCVIPGHGRIEGILKKYHLEYRIIKIRKWIFDPRESRILFWIRRIYRNILNTISEIKLMVLCKQKKIEIIHLNSSTSPSGFLSAKLLRLKLVWHIREYVEEDFGYRFYNKASALKRIGSADAIIAVSKAIANKYQNDISKNKLRIIYNGIDNRIYRKNSEIFEDKKVTIVHIGRIEKNKGQEDLLQACCYLEKRISTEYLKVLIIGEGEKSYIRYLKNKFRELESFVIFTGYCSDIEMVLRKADIVIVNSKCEAFGRVTVEAMLAERLVIGSNTGCTPELLNDNCGILFEYGDNLQLCNKICEVLRNKDDAKKIASNGRSKAEHYYTSNLNAQCISDLYAELKG